MQQEKIGLKIKELRRQKNLTQTDLANSLGYSDKSVISHIEKGDADMTYEKILLLLRTYVQQCWHDGKRHRFIHQYEIQRVSVVWQCLHLFNCHWRHGTSAAIYDENHRL